MNRRKFLTIAPTLALTLPAFIETKSQTAAETKPAAPVQNGVTIPHVRDFKFDPTRGCHCQKFWPQFETLDNNEIQENIEFVLAHPEYSSPEKLKRYREALRLVQIFTHESFLQACQVLQDEKYGIDFYQTHGDNPGHILAFQQCCR